MHGLSLFPNKFAIKFLKKFYLSKNSIGTKFYGDIKNRITETSELSSF